MPDAPSDLNAFSRIAAELMVASQTAALQVLGVEMQELARMIPGAVPASAAPLPDEDEIERGFDNMPV